MTRSRSCALKASHSSFSAARMSIAVSLPVGQLIFLRVFDGPRCFIRRARGAAPKRHFRSTAKTNLRHKPAMSERCRCHFGHRPALRIRFHIHQNFPRDDFWISKIKVMQACLNKLPYFIVRRIGAFAVLENHHSDTDAFAFRDGRVDGLPSRPRHRVSHRVRYVGVARRAGCGWRVARTKPRDAIDWTGGSTGCQLPVNATARRGS